MTPRPKDKSTPTAARHDSVSLIVGFGLAALTLGGILAIFSAPLRALIGR